MATHTWGWRVFTWGRPLTPGDGRFTCGDGQKKNKAGVLFLPFEKRQFCHSRHHRWRPGRQVLRIGVVGDAASLAPPSAGKPLPMRFAPPRPCETSSRPRRSAAAGSEQMSAAFVRSSAARRSSARAPSRPSPRRPRASRCRQARDPRPADAVLNVTTGSLANDALNVTPLRFGRSE